MQRGLLRARPRLRALLASAAALGAITLHGACSNQGLGERCSYVDDNDACQDGLRCTAADQLVDQNSPRCCPVDLSTITAGACRPRSAQGTNTTPSGTDASATDGGTGSDASSDAKATDATIDADGAAPGDGAVADATLGG